MTERMKAWTLARRPKGMPKPDDFELEDRPLPPPNDGEVLVEVMHLSLDPYMRGRMDDAKSYAPSVELGGIMPAQGVGRVIGTWRGEHGLVEGDLVTGMTGWASHAAMPVTSLRRIDDEVSPTTALGVLGMPGFTAWTGLREYGRPAQGETLVVGAATGPVGSLVGQLAKEAGMRTVAVAGGEDKCALARDTFGFDAAIDHRAHDDASSLRKALAEAAPDGVDIYWENVGGITLEAVLPLMNDHGRIPLCGAVGWYGGVTDTLSLPAAWRTILVKRLSVNGFIIFDHWSKFDDFLAEMKPKVQSGEIVFREDVTEGIEAMPEAFIGLLQGRNRGKAIVTL